MEQNECIASIIIVNFNSGKVLLGSLEHLTWVHEDYTYELIIVDNGSTDNSLDAAMREYPWIKSVRSSKNLGFGRGCNLGAQYARGGVLIFVNNDAWIDRGSANTLVNTLIINPDTGAIGPVILKPDSCVVDSMGGHILRYLGIAPSMGSGRLWMKSRRREYRVPWVSGAVLATRKDLFVDSGGFDPLIFFYYEDVDYCWRLRLRGYEVIVTPSSTAFHKGSSTVSKVRMKRAKLLNFGRILTNAKNLSTRSLFAWLTLELPFFFWRFANISKTEKVSYFYEYTEAWFLFLTKLPLILPKRRLLQSKRMVPDSQILQEHISLVSLMHNWREYT